MKELLFICGALRSGTTLLHLLMDNHIEISNKGEFDFLFDYKSWSTLSVAQYAKYLENDRIFLSHNLVFPVFAKSFSDVINDFINQSKTESNILALNVHRNFEKIPMLFPSAKYLHLIRDPRDVANSSVGMGWAGNVFHGVDHWIKTEESWFLLRSHLAPEQFHEVYFEELISSPEKTLIGICQFLNIAFDKHMLDYHKSSTYDKPDVNLINQWQQRLSTSEINLVESKASSLMIKLGYDIYSKNITTPCVYYRIYLVFNNKFFRAKYAINKYGVLLFIKDKISQKLRLEKMAYSVQTQKNKIDVMYLK